MQRVLFVTGTDTGVGKTVLACLLAERLFARGVCVAAYKPLCSGGRADAEALQAALGGLPELDAINPWHFPAPLAPLLAARSAGQAVRLPDVIQHAKRLLLQHDLLLVEGAGGLLSPLGEGFDSLDLIRAWKAAPIIVCPNRLGVVNQARLVWTALPASAQARAQVVLVSPPEPDASVRTNARLLAEYLDPARLHELPWLAAGAARPPRVTRHLDGLLAALGLPASCSA